MLCTGKFTCALESAKYVLEAKQFGAAGPAASLPMTKKACAPASSCSEKVAGAAANCVANE